MTTRLTLAASLIGASAALALSACGDEHRPIGSNIASFDGVIDSGGTVAPFTASDEVVESATFTEAVGDEVYWCTRETHDVTSGGESFPTFDPNSEIVFPGNLLQGATLEQATPSPIPVARGGGTVVMTLINGSSGVSRTLPVVSLGSVTEAMNSIIAGASPDLPARTTYAMSRISSREQLGVAINAEFHTLASDVQGSFAFKSDVTYNRILVELTQSYYTIAFELPTRPEQLFDASVTPADLARYVGPGNPATFISSVTYGRVFYLLIQSTSSYQSMEAAIDASFQAAVAGGSLSAEVEYVSELESLQIGGYALGGDSVGALRALQGDFADLATFIAEGGRITTGTPLSYVVRSVARPDQIVRVKVATEYDVVECKPLGESLDAPVAWFRADSGVVHESTSLGGQGVTRWDNLVDEGNPAIVPAGGPRYAGLYNGDHVSFQYAASFSTGTMSFNGGDIGGGDYTLFIVVAAIVNPDDFLPCNVLWGNDDSAGRGLFVGFDGNNTFRVSHGEGRVATATLPTAVQDYHLYTVRFSREDGLAIWVDGVERASDPAFAGVDSWTGAGLGATGLNGFGDPFISTRVTELRLFGSAAATEQRKAVEDVLLDRYSL